MPPVRHFGRPTRVLAAGIGILAAAALAACGTGGHSAGKSGPLSLYSDNPSWTPGFKKAGNVLQTITGHGLAPVTLPSTANYEQVVKTSLTTAKATDIVKWWSGYKLQDLASTGDISDLTSVWNYAQRKGWVSPSLKSAYSYKGKVYGLPMYQSYWVVFYNKAIFAKYNLQPPTTYDDFNKIASTLKTKGVTPLWTGQADVWPSFVPYQMLLGALDPSFYQKLTNDQASFTDATSKQAMQIWSSWINHGWTTPADSKLVDAPALMKSGKVAMLPMGSWENSNLKLTGMRPGKDYGAFLFPAIPPNTKQAVFIEGGAWTVPVHAPDHDAAIAELKNWLNPSVQKVWSGFLGDSSANPKVKSTDPVIQSVQSQIASSNPVLLNRYYESFPSKLVINSTSSLDGFMAHPNAGVQTLQAMQSDAVKEWADWKQNAGG
jgi:multiple sugar transport system substrate-binding protein